MSQHDFNIANQGFPNFRADLNNALAALASLSSGDTEPSTTYANQLWYDTANNYLKYRNEANSDWIVLFEVTDTGIRAIDELQVRSSGAEASVNIKNTNTGGADPDATLYLDSGNINGEATVEFMKGGTSYGRLTALQSDMRLVSDTGDIEFSAGGSVRATISSGGNFGIGYVPGAAALGVSTTGTTAWSYLVVRNTTSEEYAGIGFNGDDASSDFIISRAGTGETNIAITSSGDINLNGGGDAVGGFTFTDLGTVTQYRDSSSATTGAYNIYSDWGATNRNVFRIRTDGNVLNYNNSYGALSDAKLKENVADATPKLEDLCKLRVVNFNYIGDENKQLGLIAQEVEQVFPKLVDNTPDTDADGNETGEVTKSVKYSILVPMLVKALQEQQDMISALEARISAIEAK